MPSKKKGSKAADAALTLEDAAAPPAAAPVQPAPVVKAESTTTLVISKRLRAARKKLGRIQELEASLAAGEKQINADQEELLRSKPGLLVIIEELEKVHPLIRDASKEEIDQVTEQVTADTLAQAASERDSAIEAAVAEALEKAQADAVDAAAAAAEEKVALEQAAVAEKEAAVAAAVSKLLQLVYFSQLFSQPLSSAPEREACVSYDKGEDGEPVTEKNLLDITKLGQLVSSRTNKLLSHKDALEECTQLAHKWLSLSDEEVPELGDVKISAVHERLERVIASDYFNIEPERRVLETPVEESHIHEGGNQLPPYMADRGAPMHPAPPAISHQAPPASGGLALLDDPAIAYISTTGPPIMPLPHSTGLQTQPPAPHFGLAHLGIPNSSYPLPYPQPVPSHPNHLHPSLPHYPIPGSEPTSGFGPSFGSAPTEPKRDTPAAALVSAPEALPRAMPAAHPDHPHSNGSIGQQSAPISQTPASLGPAPVPIGQAPAPTPPSNPPHPISHPIPHPLVPLSQSSSVAPLSHPIPAPPPPPKPQDATGSSAVAQDTPSAPPLPMMLQVPAASFPVPQPQAFPANRSFERGGRGRGGGGRGPRGPRQDRNSMPIPEQLGQFAAPGHSEGPRQERESNGSSGHREGGSGRSGRGGGYRGGRGGAGGQGRGMKPPSNPQQMLGVMNGIPLGQMPIPQGAPMMPPSMMPYH